MMVVVFVITGIVLFIAERNTQASFQEASQQQFQSKISYELGLEEGRRAKAGAALERIKAAANLSRDLSDIVDRALASH